MCTLIDNLRTELMKSEVIPYIPNLRVWAENSFTPQRVTLYILKHEKKKGLARCGASAHRCDELGLLLEGRLYLRCHGSCSTNRNRYGAGGTADLVDEAVTLRDAGHGNLAIDLDLIDRKPRGITLQELSHTVNGLLLFARGSLLHKGVDDRLVGLQVRNLDRDDAERYALLLEHFGDRALHRLRDSLVAVHTGSIKRRFVVGE